VDYQCNGQARVGHDRDKWARHLSGRADPGRCSRADFTAGYLTFAIENALLWPFQDYAWSAAS
jgi:hypothetical protein